MINLQTTLSDFEEALDKVIKQTWTVQTQLEYIEELSNSAPVLTADIIRIGDLCTEQLQKEDADIFSSFLIHFNWIEKAKAFLILWRDVLFQTQKAQILTLENKATNNDLEKLKSQSKLTIIAAADDLKTYFEKEYNRCSRLKNGREKQIAQWRLQQNPYSIYREQLQDLSEQCLELFTKYNKLREVSSIFSQIIIHIQNTLIYSQKTIKEAKSLSQRAIDFIEENMEEKISKIPAFLEDLEEELTSTAYLDIFSAQLDEISGAFNSKMQVPVNTMGGLIQFKEINFKRSVRLWLESEILPILYEVWELTENSNNAVKMSFLNIRNRAFLLSNEVKEGGKLNFEKEDLSQLLNVFMVQTTKRAEDLSALKSLIDERLNQSFGVFTVYQLHEVFLSLPLQSTINQFKIRQNKWLIAFQNWLNKQATFLQNFKTSVEIEESLSVSEKIVRFIQSRTMSPENYHYSSIFLTKGYIGESFWVGRKKELQHIEKLIQQWKQGFRGAVILSGQRFSGKSLFGDLVVNQHFAKNSIRLSPNSTIKFQGRQFTSTFDLDASLNFIRKHSLPHHLCVWIDDLELWSDPNISLSQNVRNLCEYIDDYSGKIFFMVSMNNWLKNHLHNIHDIGKKFQTEINLDEMNEAEVREAILIRHGATHKNLVHADGREISPQIFKKITTKIHKNTDGNIGEALQKWAFSVQKIDEEQVTFEPKAQFALPDFINPDIAILLTALMMEKRSNEYRLRKLFGIAFKEKYAGILQRLLNVGLLTRHLDDWLEVNENAVNEVGKSLDKKGFLKFYH